MVPARPESRTCETAEKEVLVERATGWLCCRSVDEAHTVVSYVALVGMCVLSASVCLKAFFFIYGEPPVPRMELGTFWLSYLPHHSPFAPTVWCACCEEKVVGRILLLLLGVSVSFTLVVHRPFVL